MKIISVTTVYNEADVLELFVRHHLRFVDHMIVVLHGRSMDDTHGVAAALASEGLPLTLLRSDLPGHQQSRILTEALRTAVGVHQPDLALMLDCDEFVCASPGQMVRAALESLPRDTVTLVPWRTFVPKTEHASWIDAMSHRRCTETPLFSKVIVPSVFLTPELTVCQGSHAVLQAASETSGVMTRDLWLAHVPIRSSLQARQKGLHAWPRQRDNPGHKPGDGFQWESLHERAVKSGGFSREELTEIAATYACTRHDVCPTLLVDPFTRYVSGL